MQVFPEEGGEPTMKTCMVYVMNGRRGRMEPSPSYYKILKDAYEYHHFPKHVLVAALARAMGKRELREQATEDMWSHRNECEDVDDYEDDEDDYFEEEDYEDEEADW